MLNEKRAASAPEIMKVSSNNAPNATNNKVVPLG
jgi:hypothetical protein